MSCWMSFSYGNRKLFNALDVVVIVHIERFRWDNVQRKYIPECSTDNNILNFCGFIINNITIFSLFRLKLLPNGNDYTFDQNVSKSSILHGLHYGMVELVLTFRFQDKLFVVIQNCRNAEISEQKRRRNCRNFGLSELYYLNKQTSFQLP